MGKETYNGGGLRCIRSSKHNFKKYKRKLHDYFTTQQTEKVDIFWVGKLTFAWLK